MTFPHFIDSRRVGGQNFIVLWQKDHYSYEIDVTGHASAIALHVPYEEAIEFFNTYDPSTLLGAQMQYD